MFEQRKAEEERKVEEERKAAEQRAEQAKKMRKLAIKFVPPLAVAVVALVVLVGFLKDNSAYKKAGELASARRL